jgi:protoheme IX farnesyltransferase
VATLASPLILATAVIAWSRHRGARWLVGASALSLILLVFQILLGGVTVLTETPPNIVALHLGNAFLILALQVLIVVLALKIRSGAIPRFSLEKPLARYAAATTLATLLLLVSGALVTSTGASGSCAGWPLCDGMLWPPTLLSQVHMLHRFVAAATAALVLTLSVIAWNRRKERPVAFIATCVALALVVAQVIVGMFNVLRGFPVVLNGLHVVTATAAWAGLVLATGLAAIEPRSAFEAAESGEDGGSPSVKDLLQLSKPVIVLLLLVTTLAAMVVAAGGWPGTSLVLWTMVGGALTAGGSSALNQYIDRHSDRRMVRTAGRPLPMGKVHEAEVLAFGALMCLAGFYALALMVNLLSALLASLGIVYYVGIYSMGLKSATTHNIVIGGGAGAIPTLVGWSAATGGLTMGAFLLFALVFFWTPPHFWALALVRRKDYARAGVPMLPVVYGEDQTRREILLYTIQVVALSLLLPVAKLGGWLFVLAALGLGGALVAYAWRLFRTGGNRNAWQMYRYSSMYLALIFTALVVDTLIT